MKDNQIRRFLVSCEFVDACPMSVLMEGCKAHAEVDAFPLWAVDFQTYVGDIVERLPHIKTLEETWVIFFPTRASLETFCELMATVEFKAPDYIRFVDFDSAPGLDLIWSMEQFHRYVFHES